MKHTIQIFFFMLSFGIVSLGSANAQRTYTLDECLEQALSNNVRMKMQRTTRRSLPMTGKVLLLNTFHL